MTEISTTRVTNPSPCGLALNIDDDNCPSTNNYTINVVGEPGTNLGTDIILKEVRLIIDHNWEQDVEIRLTAPDGTQILLSSDNGGANVSPGYGDFSIGGCSAYSSFVHPSFCDAVSITDNNLTNFIGNFYPEGDFTTFDGNDPNGDWILEVCDDASIHTGTLEYVELIFEPFFCPGPSNVFISNISANTAQVNWTNGTAGATTYIESVPSGAAPGTGQIFTSASSPFMIGGLIDNTFYDIYLYESCGNGNNSPLSCPVSLATACDAPAPTLITNFDSEATCSTSCGAACALTGIWTNDTSNDDFDWSVNDGPTSSPNTGPTDDITRGGNYIYIETSSSNCRNGNFAILQSNCITVNANSGLCHFSFYTHMFGASTGTLDVELRLSNSLTWSPIWSMTGDRGNQWFREYIDLSAYHGQMIQLRFVAYGGNNTTSDIALDDIIFYGSIDEGVPSNLYYIDADNDGYGDPNTVIATCSATAPSGYIAQGDDCDDNDASVNPSASEIPCNQLDDNCNGVADDSQLPRPVLLTSPTGLCQGTMVSLATSSTAVGQYEWYDAPVGGNLLGTGDSLTTMLTNNTSIYVVDTSSTGPGLRITEALLSFSSAALEIQNIGQAADYTGWTVVISDGTPGGNINTFNPVFWNLGIMNPFEVQTRDRNNWGQSFTWSSSFEGWIMIIDDNGNIADVMLWNWTTSELNSFDVTINGINYTKADLPWTGTSINSGTCFGRTLSMSGNTETNGSGDYSCMTNTIGSENTNLNLKSGCGSSRVAVPLTVNTQPSLSPFTTVDVCGSGLGDISIGISGGQAPYTYQWSNGATTQNLSDVFYDVYNVTVTDALGCTSEVSGGINLSGSAVPFSVDIMELEHIDCHNNDVGKIVMLVTGGTPPYQYNWSAGYERDLMNNVDSLIGLPGGSYNLTVTDHNGCVQISPMATVIEPGPLNMNLNCVEDIECFGQVSGKIDINVFGGSPPYIFNWTNGMASEDVINLEEGMYGVTIMDNNGCMLESPMYQVSTPLSPLQIDVANVGDVSCANAADGHIQINVSGGTPPYNYDWNNSDTQKDLVGISGGNYILTVTDAKGCQTISSFINIIEANNPIAISSNITDVTCHGANNGTISVNVTGGVFPYTYRWSNLETSPNLDNLSNGIYFCTVTDANGCVYSSSALTVNQNPYSLELAIDEVKELACSSTTQGSISMITSGGTPPYNYLWNNGDTVEDTDGLTGGLYNVTVTDAIGCTYSVENIFVFEPTGLRVVTTSTDATGGSNDGTATVSASGGTPPYTYEWSDSLSQTGSIAYNLLAGNYFVTVEDYNGCRIFSNVMIDMLTTTSIDEEIDILSALDIFPNPTNAISNIDIQLESATEIEIMVYNVAGQRIMQMQRAKQKEHQLQIDFANHPNGIYLVQVLIGDQFVTKKVMVGGR